MTTAFYLAAWYFAILLPGVLGFRVLTRLDAGPLQAWAGGRVVGLCMVTLLAWWAGVLGLEHWLALGAALLGVGSLYALFTSDWKQVPRRQLACMELVFLAACCALLLLRWFNPEIRGTEKPMDYGIVNTLLITGAFPPDDFWLSGRELAYYYWGQLLWTIPIRLTGIPSEYAYNIVVATVGGLVAALTWAVARSLGASSRAAAVSVFLNLFAGTPDGLRQLLVSRSIAAVDLWDSSRQVENAITEYPLFTAWLGDLHAHYLVLPVFLTTILLSLRVHNGRGATPSVVLIGICLGIASMTNPWSLPVLLAVVAALALNPSSRFPWPVHRLKALAAYLGIVCLAAFAIAAPFDLRFDPPFQGLALSNAQTRTTELLLYAGALVVPLVVFLYRSLVRLDRESSGDNLRVLVAAAAVVVAAAASGRPLTVLLVALLASLALLWARERRHEHSGTFVVAGVGVMLLLVPEIIYVDDPYHASLHRMNTVFKSYFQAWILLALVVPLFIERTYVRTKTSNLVFGLMVLVSLPHLAAAPLARPGGYSGLDGLEWMSEGDRGIVEYLREHGRRGAIVESVGPAYGDAGRISSATGLPALLGWRNHELVWRGPGITAELNRRARIVETIYSSADPARIRALAERENIHYIVIGSRERALYTEAALHAVEASGTVVARFVDTSLVRF